MIGVDANVLVRLFVDDAEEQHRRAVAFFAARSVDDPAYVDLLVLAEFAWVLDRRYGYSATHIAEAVAQLLDAVDVTVEHHDLVREAVTRVTEKVGLADLLIAAKGRLSGASHVVTFDRYAARHIPEMELLT